MMIAGTDWCKGIKFLCPDYTVWRMTTATCHVCWDRVCGDVHILCLDTGLCCWGRLMLKDVVYRISIPLFCST